MEERTNFLLDSIYLKYKESVNKPKFAIISIDYIEEIHNNVDCQSGLQYNGVSGNISFMGIIILFVRGLKDNELYFTEIKEQ